MENSRESIGLADNFKSDFKTEALNWINGQAVPSLNETWFESIDPATGSAMAQVANSDVLDLVQALRAAHKAQADWSKSDEWTRAEHLRAFAKALQARSEEVARMEARETGTPLMATRQNVARAIEVLNFHAALLLTKSESGLVLAMGQFAKHRSPLGVIALLLGWPEASFSLLSRLAPALAAGNVALVKPSSRAGLTSHLIAEIAHASGLPPGVLSLLQGRGVDIGQALLDHPGVHTLAFVGQMETGKLVLKGAAEFLKRTHLALGGANSVFVFADCDLEKTAAKVARICWSGLWPVPLRASRIFVQESIYKTFLDQLRSEVERIKIGDPLDEATELGPLQSRVAQESFHGHVRQAQSEKGKALFSGESRLAGLGEKFKNGFFVDPAGFYDLTLCSTLQQTEIPGPLALIASFKYQHEVMKLSANSPLTLASHVFHAQSSKLGRVVSKIPAARVYANPKDFPYDPRVSHGGHRNFAFSTEGGDELLRFFSHESLIYHDLAD